MPLRFAVSPRILRSSAVASLTHPPITGAARRATLPANLVFRRNARQIVSALRKWRPMCRAGPERTVSLGSRSFNRKQFRLTLCNCRNGRMPHSKKTSLPSFLTAALPIRTRAIISPPSRGSRWREISSAAVKLSGGRAEWRRNQRRVLPNAHPAPVSRCPLPPSSR